MTYYFLFVNKLGSSQNLLKIYKNDRQQRIHNNYMMYGAEKNERKNIDVENLATVIVRNGI